MLKGEVLGKKVIKSEDFSRRRLELAVPDKGNPMQQRILQELDQYATTQKVKLKVAVVK